MRSMTGYSDMPSDLDDVIRYITRIAKLKTMRSIVSKLVFAATCYFIWQERNKRLFTKEKRTCDHIIEVIRNTVRLKLVTCRFKKTNNVKNLLQLWRVPNSRVYG